MPKKSKSKNPGKKKSATRKQPASGVEKSQEPSPADKRKATMARNAEEDRRAAAGDDPDARDVQDADAERNRLDRGSEVDRMRERLRQLEELVAAREGIDLRQAQLDENAGSLMQRRADLLAAQRLREPAPRSLPAARAADASARGLGITPVARSVGPSAAEDVSITGTSRVASSPSVHDPTADPAAIATAAAEFVKSRFTFAAATPSYFSFPSVDVNLRCIEDRLTANLRLAQQDSDPNPASLSFALGDSAQAARCLIPGLGGERVSALIHGQVLNLSNALASIASRMGDAADVAALTRMIVREVFRHLQNDGSDPAAFVRKRLDELRIAADMRLVKHSFAPAAAASRSQALPGVSSSPAVPLPPGLGYGSALPPFPQLVGLAQGQAKSDKLRRWIRYPREPHGAVIMMACMLCGQGSTPGSVGHRSDACNATPQQQVDWINHAIPVK